LEYDNNKITTLPFEPEPGSLKLYHSVLLELKKLDKTNLHEFLRSVLDVVSNALNVERVSVWFFNEEKTAIYCDYLYIKKMGEFSNEETLFVNDYPEYFKSITTQLYVAADDAKSNQFTKELAEKYLIPRKIYSMMDIPIHFLGETVGVICHEETDAPRMWKREEIDFSAAISALVSTSLEIDLRKKRETDLQESQRFLATLITNLPGYVYRVEKQPNGDWHTTYISDGVYELTGYPTKAFTDGTAYYVNMVYDDDKKSTREAIVKALNEHKPYEITYRIKTINNDVLWVWEQGRGVYSDSGELIATEGFITDITEKKLYEQELLHKNNQLSVLNRLGQSLTELAEPEKIIDNICRLLAEIFDIKNLYIALFDQSDNSISFPYYSIEGKVSRSIKRQFARGLTEYIIKTRKSIIINSAKSDFYRENDIDLIGRDSLSLISAPMIAGEKVLGVITLQDYENENVYTNSQLEVLTTLASQAAIALENSNLYDEIKKSLHEKDILLKEVHHRVKNNLQIMSSLVKLQSHHLSDEKMLDIIKEMEGRIQSMAIVHSKLYKSGDYERINLNEYVKNLVDNFWNTFGFRFKNIAVTINVLDEKLNIDTVIPLGLIINELVSNSIKYAFKENEKGEIYVSLCRTDKGNYKLSVKDNGIGLSSSIDISNPGTLGIQLVSLLSKQLDGSAEIVSSTGKGTEFIITFNEVIYKSRK
jgi:PAS domain S-box-containing protein